MAKMNLIRAAVFASALAVPMAATTSAQPVVTGGLVNVTVFDVIDGDVLSNNNVSLGVALGLAASICDVNVNVLAVQLRNGGATCQSTVERVVISQPQQQ